MIQQNFFGLLGVCEDDVEYGPPCSDTSSAHISVNSEFYSPFQQELFDFQSLPNDRLPGDFVPGEDDYWGELAPKTS